LGKGRLQSRQRLQLVHHPFMLTEWDPPPRQPQVDALGQILPELVGRCIAGAKERIYKIFN
jgi:hypothetical protein